EPYWTSARFTGAGQALRRAVRDLYGAEPSAATIEQINAGIRERNKPGLYRSLLRDRSRIRFCVLDDSCGGCIKTRGTEEDRELFVLARRFDQFVVPMTPENIQTLEHETGTSITSVDGLTRALEKSFEDNRSQGMRAVK